MYENVTYGLSQYLWQFISILEETDDCCAVSYNMLAGAARLIHLAEMYGHRFSFPNQHCITNSIQGEEEHKLIINQAGKGQCSQLIVIL